MFHLAAFGATTLVAGGTTDLTFFTDPEISVRSGHMYLSEPYKMFGVTVLGLQVTEARILSPTLNAVTQFSVWPINAADNPASPPRVDFWFDTPVPLPQNEEIQVQVVTNAVADQVTALLWIAPVTWQPNNIPKGIPPVPVFDTKVTFSPTGVLNAWSTPVTLTFAQNLRGGTYAVVGWETQGTNMVASRLIFPSAYIYKGPSTSRRLRPGTISSNTLGDYPVAYGYRGVSILGQFGQFTTSELPLVEVAASAAGAITAQGRLRLVRIREEIRVDYGGNGMGTY